MEVEAEGRRSLPYGGSLGGEEWEPGRDASRGAKWKRRDQRHSWVEEKRGFRMWPESLRTAGTKA